MKNWKRMLAGVCAATMIVSGMTITAAADGTSLVFCDTMSSPEREALFADLFARYEEQTGVSVEYTTIPYEEAENKLVAMAATESLPDVIATGSMAVLAHMDALEPLTEYWANYEYLDEVMPATQTFVEELGTLNGEIYCIPDSFILRGVFVRTDWMEEAGLNVADYEDQMSWEDYFNIIEAINDPENGRYGIAFRGGQMNMMAPGEYLQSVMGWDYQMLSDEQSIYGTEEAIEYIGRYLDLYKNGYAPEEAINWGYPEMVEGFVSGQCGTLVQTPEVVPVCEESMEPGTWTVLPWPTQEGLDKDVMCWGSSTAYVMSAFCEDKDAAWDLLAWLSSPEINLEYCKEFGAIPINQSALEDPYFAEGVSKGYVTRLLSENFTTAISVTEIPDMNTFNDLVMAENQKYLLGEQDLATSLKNMDDWLVGRIAEIRAEQATETEAAE